MKLSRTITPLNRARCRATNAVRLTANSTPEGKKQEATEDFNQVIRRVLGKFKAGSRLLILNDEAHHCYLPKEEGRSTEGEDTREENARAAVWFNGLTEIANRFKVDTLYDLSATPYYLTGSGYQAYSLFPWVVSDFGLIECVFRLISDIIPK